MMTHIHITNTALRAAEFIDATFIQNIVISPVFWFADSLGIQSRILFPTIYAGKIEELDNLYDNLPKESKIE